MEEASHCEVCGATIALRAKRCVRCNKFVNRRRAGTKPQKAVRVEALKRSWRSEDQRFHCHYTDAALDEEDPHSPRYLAFDHRTPREESDIVVTMQLINDMKSDLSEDEFRTVVKALAQRFDGGAFDARVLNVTRFKRGG